MSKGLHCTYHCRACGGHFTSLAAFDAHRAGPSADRTCYWPDDAPLIERQGGVCKHARDGQIRSGVTLYEHASAQRARDTFQTAERSHQGEAA